MMARTCQATSTPTATTPTSSATSVPPVKARVRGSVEYRTRTAVVLSIVRPAPRSSSRRDGTSGCEPVAGSGPSGVSAGAMTRSVTRSPIRGGTGSAGGHRHTAGGGGSGQQAVVAGVHVGVLLGEVGDRFLEGGGGAQVAGDGDAVAGAGVGPREAPGAHLAVELQTRGPQLLDGQRALPVAQLSEVEVPFDAVDAGRALPAEEDVTRLLHQALACHHPLPLIRVPALADVVGVHRSRCLLDLEQEGVVVVPPDEEDDPAARTDTADPHHLPGHVHEGVALEQRAADRKS